MISYQNHVIDPTYFFDAIEEFSFNYNIYVVVNEGLDKFGKRISNYDKQTIRGSLQLDELKLNQSKQGNTHEASAKFYCKSLYRINIGDIIEYKNNYYRVEAFQPYDEFGVREASLKMIKLAQYRDLADYLKYLKGEKII